MFVKVFFLGRPGSGKTTAIHHFLALARQHNIPTLNIDDYNILYHMSHDDAYRTQFRKIDYDGFDILDLSMYDVALEKLEQQIRTTMMSTQDSIMAIEFARNDYRHAFSIFQPDFLKDAYVFFVDTDLNMCIQRIHQRVRSPQIPNNHLVSDYIMNTHYNRENRLYVEKQMEKEYKINKAIKVFHNNGPITVLIETLNEFFEHIYQTEFGATSETMRSESVIKQPLLIHS